MYKAWELLNLYFDKDDYTTFGGKYTSKVLSVDEMVKSSNPEFFCINPLDPNFDHYFYMKESYDYYIPRRCDGNVIKFRNFLFEIDTLSLEDQMNVLTKCDIPWTGITYSGGKSYHAILSLENPLKLNPHNTEAILAYKDVWNRLKGYIELKYEELYGEFKSIIDVSNKNPSRFSRFPGSVRDNGKEQSVELIGKRISDLDFESLLLKCPKIAIIERDELKAPEQEISSVGVFLDICPNALKKKLLYVDWGADAGMYPFIYKYTAWAIDSTNVCYATFIEFLREHTFSQLVSNFRYPIDKLRNLEDCVYNVYKRKYKL